MAHLPEDDLPSNFDVIVDGTGLVQSILAAALARAGKSVLHIDRCSYYGELWASLMHRELLLWMEGLIDGDTLDTAYQERDSPVTPPPTSEDWVTVKQVPPSVTNIYQEVPNWTITESESEQAPSSQPQPHGLVNELSPDRESGGLGTGHEADASCHTQDASVDHTRAGDEEGGHLNRAEMSEEGRHSNGAEGTNEGEHSNDPNIASSAEQEGTSEGAAVVEPRTTDNQMTQLSWNNLDNLKRRLNYDILPKVLYCRGSLVDLLTQSSCGRYVEFKAVGKIFTQINGEVEQVPCSRADMFATKSLSVMDKRKMMRFLSFCAEYEDHPEQYQEFEGAPFVEFLTKNDLQFNLRQYIIHCIAMVEETIPTAEALKATKLFLTSLGRFGNAPFLYPIFGVGELAQAFCRMCAVFGGVYCLRRYIKTMVVSTDTHKLIAVICSTGQRLTCSAAVCSATQLAATFQFSEASTTCRVSRAIFILDGPIANTQGSLAVITLPSSTIDTFPPVTIRLLQLDSSTNTAVPGTYMVHAMCTSVASSAEIDLRPVCSTYFSTPDDVNNMKPRLLYALYFNTTLTSFNYNSVATIDGLPDNVLVTSDPAASMTFEGAVSEARELFTRVCPGKQFLPPPPDPEDIVYDEPPAEAVEHVDTSNQHNTDL